MCGPSANARIAAAERGPRGTVFSGGMLSRMKERAVPVNVPGLAWSAGAPEPFIVSSEQRTLLGFYAQSEDGDQSESEAVSVAELVGCTSVKFGFPNDEALHGHRLYGAGLGYYQLHEVDNSAWLIELRAIEAVHHRAPAVPFENARHFVLTFHDSTVEAIARDVRLVGSLRHTGRSHPANDNAGGPRLRTPRSTIGGRSGHQLAESGLSEHRYRPMECAKIRLRSPGLRPCRGGTRFWKPGK